MASSALIQHVSGNVIPKTACDDLIQIKSTSTTKTTGTAPLVAETNTSNKEGARELFLSQEFDNDTVDILMTSWGKCTFSNYSLYMSKWFKFTSCDMVSTVEPPAQVALAFMTLLAKQRKSFTQISVVRSALPSVINQQQNASLSNISIVRSYMKGIFENKPILANFHF